MLQVTKKGLYCPDGDFFIDPLQSVSRAVLTHAHADHARRGSEHYFVSAASVPLLQRRLGTKAYLQSLAYGEKVSFGQVTVSLHPAGHMLGSAQVRVERGGEVWVVTGDFKRAPDPTCLPFEPVTCHTLVTEATFGLPIYRWPSVETVLDSGAQRVLVTHGDGSALVRFLNEQGVGGRRVSAMLLSDWAKQEGGGVF